MLARDQAIRNADAKFASQVIVAGTRVPERFVGLRTRLKSRRSGERYRHDAFEHLAHVRTGQSIVTVAALLAEIDQARIVKLGEMTAGGLRGDPGHKRQLARRECAAIKQRTQDISAGRIADQRRDLGHLWGGMHRPNMRPKVHDASANTSATTETIRLTLGTRVPIVGYAFRRTRYLSLGAALAFPAFPPQRAGAPGFA